MIKVKRSTCPDILDNSPPKKSLGREETTQAITFYSDANNKEKTFKIKKADGTYGTSSYRVYKDSNVRESLIDMFSGKCAYCESTVVTVCPGDIEHFRPKGRYVHSINGQQQKPGYYWLASNWENLLLACPFCNQTNTHEVFKNGQWVKEVQGKLDQFPLDDETKRLTSVHGQIFLLKKSKYMSFFREEEKVRLLLNPCIDNVTAYFQYNKEGLIQPKSNLSLIDTKRANTSIRVYALQRVYLVQQRKQKIIEIKSQIHRINELIDSLNKLSGQGFILIEIKLEKSLTREMKKLKQFMNKNQSYAGLARYFINLFFSGFL